MTAVVYVAVLTVIWVLAWGSASFANVASGVVVALVLWALSPDRVRPGPVTVRPLPLLRLVAHVLAGAVTSNAQLARTTLRRHLDLRSGIVTVELPSCSDGALTAITNLLALSPGMAVVDVRRTPTVLDVHVLQLDSEEAARAQVRRLADLVLAAFGPAEAEARPASAEPGGRP